MSRKRNQSSCEGDVKSKLAAYRERKEQSPVFVSNCVATAWFDTEIDIKKLVWTCYGELDPTTFAAAKFRVGKSKARALVFSSGKIVTRHGGCRGEAISEQRRSSKQ